MRSDLVDALLDAAQSIEAIHVHDEITVDVPASLNPCGEIPLGPLQYTVLKGRESPWPCFIEAGPVSSELEFNSICSSMQRRADEEEVPVRFSVTGAVWVAFPGEPMPVAEPAQHKYRPSNFIWHQTAITGGMRGGKTQQMREEIKKTLMEILAEEKDDV
jgi:hypothetical protein